MSEVVLLLVFHNVGNVGDHRAQTHSHVLFRLEPVALLGFDGAEGRESLLAQVCRTELDEHAHGRCADCLLVLLHSCPEFSQSGRLEVLTAEFLGLPN